MIKKFQVQNRSKELKRKSDNLSTKLDKNKHRPQCKTVALVAVMEEVAKLSSSS